MVPINVLAIQIGMVEQQVIAIADQIKRHRSSEASSTSVDADVVNPYDEDDPFARFRYSVPIGVHRIGDELTVTITREATS